MNNLQLIEKALYYIDEHICEELTYEHLAGVFGYSSFHFHKIFSSVTELTITEYIRKRRLTMAHKKLCETTESVTDICYSIGFNSIQTFNRAFKNTFGMQPLVARKKQSKITYRTVEEIITGYLKRVAVEGEFSIEPRFEERDKFIIAGYRKHTKDGFNVIGESWYELKSNMKSIERKNEHTMYGFEDYSEDFSAEPLAFYYMAGVEVDKDTDIPEGMHRKVVPKAKYAVFTVNGNNANGEIGKAFHYIYFVWLPNSEYCIDENALSDFEYYDERWDCQLGTAQMDIYVPVRKMEG
ncbi:MAG: AraC family transcriptional regulator [Eubacterium sp.]|nr:AraC family transcriptional regulator [Eubacterium sp.]